MLERPPSAELRPDQLDEDSLPPYEVLDRILEAYVERDEGIEDLVAEGLPEETVMEVVRLVDRAEYKRRQAPPGIRVSNKAFGRDRRLPDHQPVRLDAPAAALAAGPHGDRHRAPGRRPGPRRR